LALFQARVSGIADWDDSRSESREYNPYYYSGGYGGQIPSAYVPNPPVPAAAPTTPRPAVPGAVPGAAPAVPTGK